MLGQTMTNKKEKSMKYDRKSMWNSSVMRRVIRVQTIQASAVTTNKNIFRVWILYNTSEKKC